MSNEFKQGHINPNSDRVVYTDRLSIYSDEDKAGVLDAFDIANEAHTGQMRISQEDYFEHLKAVSFILFDECKIHDPAIIKASLLHDILEDTTFFGDPTTVPYSVWIEDAKEKLTERFGEETADIVVAVTRPPVDDNVQFFSKEQRREFYYTQLAQNDPKALLVKVADRLHNLRTQYQTPLEQQKRKVKETEEHYLGLFDRLIDAFPIEGTYLMIQIQQELEKLHASFNDPKMEEQTIYNA